MLALMQLGWGLTARNLAVSAASEGARRAALAGAELESGAARTRELLAGTPLVPAGSEVLAQTIPGESGWPTVRIEVRGSLPVLGPWGPAGTLHVAGHAPVEPELPGGVP